MNALLFDTLRWTNFELHCAAALQVSACAESDVFDACERRMEWAVMWALAAATLLAESCGYQGSK